MIKDNTKYFIKHTVVLGLVYAVFFIVFSYVFNLELNHFKSILSAVLFSVLMSIYSVNMELKTYKTYLKGEIFLAELIPTCEAVVKEIDSISIESIKSCILENAFIELEKNDDLFVVRTVSSWRNSIPIYISFKKKEDIIKIKLYKFTRTNIFEPLKATDVLVDIREIINSCS